MNVLAVGQLHHDCSYTSTFHSCGYEYEYDDHYARQTKEQIVGHHRVLVRKVISTLFKRTTKTRRPFDDEFQEREEDLIWPGNSVATYQLMMAERES